MSNVPAPVRPCDLVGAAGTGDLSRPLVTVIIAVRNEEANIGRCLAQVVAQDYPHDRLEILVADGMSTDRTRLIAESFPTNGVALRVIANPGVGRAQGLNVAIRAAWGDLVVRVDARTLVGPDYVARCVQTALETGADNVGGVQRPLAGTLTQEAFGLVMSHPFGVGNAAFRLGRRSGDVDTVYLGCFRREVFERVGLFDEDASVISEDSDINYRIRRAGGRVFLNTDIAAYYYPRETFREFGKLYFRYGGARAGNLLKHRRLTSWRQAGWPSFVLGLVTLVLLAVWDRVFLYLLGASVGLYLLIDLVVSLPLTGRARKWQLLPRLLLAFPCLHFAWALGFWKRLLVPDRSGTHWTN